MSRFASLAPLVLVLALAGCGLETEPPRAPTRSAADQRSLDRYGTVLGPDALTLSTNPDRQGGAGGGPGIGVNAFLWRASLDTIDFIPLNSADPFGGVIITDWYEPAGTEDERFKLNVYIVDTALRADAVSVAVFRQVRDGSGGWRDATVAPGTARQLENTILTRARELRIAAG